MRKTFLLIAFIFSAIFSFAQYQSVTEANSVSNVDYSLFEQQADSLFNFDWQFMLVTDDNSDTDFASPSLDDSE